MKGKRASRAFKLGNNSKTSFTGWRGHGVKVARLRGRKLVEPERLIDIIERKDEIVIIAELAGFNRENLRIHLTDQKLTLTARASDRRFRKSLNLPKRVIPETIKTTCKNGVLEIQLKKVEEERAVDKVAG
jgi:HSP20 family molecular chaperone IbpA